MKKLIDWIKNNLLISVLFALIGVPLLIHIIYKIPAPSNLFITTWNDGAGEILSYYGIVLSCIATSYLTYFAIQQSGKANELSERLLNIEEINKKAYIKLNLEETECGEHRGHLNLCLVFDNITDVPIVEFSFRETNECLIKTEPNSEFNFVNKFEFLPIDTFNNMQNKLKESMLIRYYEDDYCIFSFEVIIKGLYGYETKQIFTLNICDDKILDCLTDQIL